MKIYIELLVLVGMVLISLIWAIWFNLSQNKLRRKYNEQRAGKSERRNPFFTENSGSFTGSSQLEGRSTVQTTGLATKGEDSSSTRSTSSFFSRRFKRRN